MPSLISVTKGVRSLNNYIVNQCDSYLFWRHWQSSPFEVFPLKNKLALLNFALLKVMHKNLGLLTSSSIRVSLFLSGLWSFKGGSGIVIAISGKSSRELQSRRSLLMVIVYSNPDVQNLVRISHRFRNP